MTCKILKFFTYADNSAVYANKESMNAMYEVLAAALGQVYDRLLANLLSLNMDMNSEQL